MVTGLGVDGEVGLALQDAVHHAGTVSVGGVVSVRGRQLDNRCSWRADGDLLLEIHWKLAVSLSQSSPVFARTLQVRPSETPAVNFRSSRLEFREGKPPLTSFRCSYASEIHCCSAITSRRTSTVE